MGILSIVTNTAGQAGANPRRVKIITTDNLATVTVPGYLNQAHNSGYQMFNTDVVDMDYSYNTLTRSGLYGVFTVSVNVGNVTLTEVSGDGGGGVVLPVVSGHVPVFIGTSGTIEDGGAPPVLTVSATGQTVTTSVSFDSPGSIKTLTGVATQTVTQTAGDLTGIKGQVNCGNVSTLSSNLAGVMGEVNCADVDGAVIFGVQGRVAPTGNISGGAPVFGVFSQFDISAATLTSCIMALMAGDMGDTATPGTYPGLFGLIVSNRTQAISQAQILLNGGSTNLLQLADNSGVVGPTYFVPAGTTAGSAGDVTKCNASNALKISVNGTDYWLPLFASNS